jgi:hypothetical protein
LLLVVGLGSTELSIAGVTVGTSWSPLSIAGDGGVREGFSATVGAEGALPELLLSVVGAATEGESFMGGTSSVGAVTGSNVGIFNIKSSLSSLASSPVPASVPSE